jgi:type 1 fimbria pilin
MGFFMKLLILILVTIVLAVLFYISILNIRGDYFIIDWSHTPKVNGGNVTIPEKNFTVTMPEKNIQLFPSGGCQDEC